MKGAQKFREHASDFAGVLQTEYSRMPVVEDHSLRVEGLGGFRAQGLG